MIKASITSPFNKFPYWWRTRSHTGERNKFIIVLPDWFLLPTWFFLLETSKPCLWFYSPLDFAKFATNSCFILYYNGSWTHFFYILLSQLRPQIFHVWMLRLPLDGLHASALSPPQAIRLSAIVSPSPSHLCLVMILHRWRIYPVLLFLTGSSFNPHPETLGSSQSGIT